MYFLLTLVLAVHAQGKPDFRPSLEQFQQICREHRQGAHKFTIEAPEVGVKTFFPVLSLEGTQSRYSHMRFLESMKNTVREEPDGLHHDHGRAVYGMDKKIKVVFYRGKLFIVDGHHRALISTYLGAQTIAAEVIEDLSRLPRQKFFAEMEKRHWAYWRNHLNQPMAMVDLCAMLNDPNFQLARLILGRVDVTVSNGKLKVSRPRGAKIPLAIKINSDIPFLENHIADALRSEGVEFDDRRSEKSLTKAELSGYLEILHQKASRFSSPLQKVLLLHTPTPVAKLNLEKIVIKHLSKKNCEIDLGSAARR